MKGLQMNCRRLVRCCNVIVWFDVRLSITQRKQSVPSKCKVMLIRELECDTLVTPSDWWYSGKVKYLDELY